MKRWLTWLLAALLVLGMGPAAVAAEDSPVGVLSGDTYTNEVLGLQMTLPDTWHFLTYAEIAERMGYDSGYASAEGLQRLLDRDSYVTPMFAEALDGYGANVNLVITDLGDYQFLDERTMLDLSKDGVVSGLEGQGFTDVTVTETTTELAGQAHASAAVSAHMSILEIHMILVMVKADRYMGSLTVSSLNAQDIEEALGFFRPLDAANAQTAAANAVHDQISAAIAQKDWAYALQLLDTAEGRSYPDRDAVQRDCQNQRDYADALAAMKSGKYYTAYTLFTGLGRFQDAADKAKQCVQTTPKSKQLYRNSAYKQELVKLNIANRLKGGSHMYLVLYDMTGQTKVCTLFIRHGYDVTIYLPDDDYILKAAYGKGPWFGEEEMFGDEGDYKSLGYIELTRTGKNRYWAGTLTSEADGRTISREDF